ncbi:MAG: aminoglycoside adenylyltransferase domain-containing protein [Fimbriimonadales bacterium]
MRTFSAHFIAVTEQELTTEEAVAVQEMHRRIFELPSEWARHLEGSYFSCEQLLGPAGQPVWYLDHGSTTLERSDHCNSLVVRWTLLESTTALCGPDVRSLLHPVGADELRQEVRQMLLDWGRDILERPENYANRFYQGLILLTCCRVLHTMETGCVHSKRASTEWAKRRLPSQWHELIDRVWATRPDPATSSRTPADGEDFHSTLALLSLCLEKLRGV